MEEEEEGSIGELEVRGEPTSEAGGESVTVEVTCISSGDDDVEKLEVILGTRAVLSEVVVVVAVFSLFSLSMDVVL